MTTDDVEELDAPRDALCRLIEDMAPARDPMTGIPYGSQVEALADAIIAGSLLADLRAKEEIIAGQDRAIGVMADAINEADNIIAVNCGTDTPRSWRRTVQKVMRARTALKEAGSCK